MNVGFKITWTDEKGTERETWRTTLEGAIEYGVYLKDVKATTIRISDKPQSVPKVAKQR